jgi:Mg2+ and Co2+ transporter CorA
MKAVVLILGFLSALLIVAQLVMGLLLVNGAELKMKTMHQHSGYLTVTVVLVYIALSLSKIAKTKEG